MSPLIVSIDKLSPDGLELALDIAPQDVIEMVTNGGKQAPVVTSPLTGMLKIERLDRRLRLKGMFSVSVEFSCDRCLADKNMILNGNINETVDLLLPDGHLEDGADADEYLKVTDGRVNLAGLMSEFFWLTWPFRFICHDQCAGLCVQCGADLNEGPCGCNK